MTFATATLLVVVLALLAGCLVYCMLAIGRLKARIETLVEAQTSSPVPPLSPAVGSTSPAAAVGAVSIRPAAQLDPPLAQASVPAPPPSHESVDVTPAVLTVIAAAVHATLGSRLRIVSIVPSLSAAGASWSVEGRRDVFSSHQVR